MTCKRTNNVKHWSCDKKNKNINNKPIVTKEDFKGKKCNNHDFTSRNNAIAILTIAFTRYSNVHQTILIGIILETSSLKLLTALNKNKLLNYYNQSNIKQHKNIVQPILFTMADQLIQLNIRMA